MKNYSSPKTLLQNVQLFCNNLQLGEKLEYKKIYNDRFIKLKTSLNGCQKFQSDANELLNQYLFSKEKGLIQKEEFKRIKTSKSQRKLTQNHKNNKSDTQQSKETQKKQNSNNKKDMNQNQNNKEENNNQKQDHQRDEDNNQNNQNNKNNKNNKNNVNSQDQSSQNSQTQSSESQSNQFLSKSTKRRKLNQNLSKSEQYLNQNLENIYNLSLIPSNAIHKLKYFNLKPIRILKKLQSKLQKINSANKEINYYLKVVDGTKGILSILCKLKDCQDQQSQVQIEGEIVRYRDSYGIFWMRGQCQFYKNKYIQQLKQILESIQ